MIRSFSLLFFAALAGASPGFAGPGDTPATVAPLITADPGETPETVVAKAAHVVPTPRQLAFHRREFIAFIHFGPNTFTGREWGDGKENPAVFAPTGIDTDQWCETLKAAGVREVVMTFKHHDGYVLWQSRYEAVQTIKNSPYENGRADVAKRLSASCRKYGLDFGVYVSPADLYQIESTKGLYGNGSRSVRSVIPTDPAAFLDNPERARAGLPADAPRFTYVCDDYNRYMLNQLYELLTDYGPVREVWFDGATPKTKGGQRYTYADWYAMIRRLAPEAVIFGKGPDARWCGNEAGGTRAEEWNVIPLPVRPEEFAWDDMTAADLGSRDKLKGARYLYYYPAETNTSIRHGWFYRDDTHQTVRTPDDVFDIYERSVGGNSVFMLNVPPNKEGRFSPRDTACLLEVGRRIRGTYGVDLAEGGTVVASGFGEPDAIRPPDGTPGEVVVTLPHRADVNRFMFGEDIVRSGQRIERHALDAMVDGRWTEVATGTTVGYKKILRFPTVTTGRLRLRILRSRLTPTLAGVSLHHYAQPPLPVRVTRDVRGAVTLAPEEPAFTGKGAGHRTPGLVVRYTLDGSEPAATSPVCSGPLTMPDGGRVRARCFAGTRAGPVAEAVFGPIKYGWKLIAEGADETATRAVDDDPETYWLSGDTSPESLVIDFGRSHVVAAMTCSPPRSGNAAKGVLERGMLETSADGRTWSVACPFEFGNLINDPTMRTLTLPSPREARFLRLSGLRGAQGARRIGVAEIGILTPPAR